VEVRIFTAFSWLAKGKRIDDVGIASAIGAEKLGDDI